MVPCGLATHTEDIINTITTADTTIFFLALIVPIFISFCFFRLSYDFTHNVMDFFPLVTKKRILFFYFQCYNMAYKKLGAKQRCIN